MTGSKLLCILVYLIVVSHASANGYTKRKELHATSAIGKNGYPSETHYVTTTDGYILTLHRIPHGINASTSIPNRVVLLPQCLACNTFSYLVQGPNGAFAYLLADSGYDVWILNSRGNTYSTNHTSLSTKSPKFWDFTFHEHGIYDVPQTIDYILERTGVQKLDIGGHSMAISSTFIMLSTLPEYNDKIRAIGAMAPAIFLKYASAPVTGFSPLNAKLHHLFNGLKFYYIPQPEWRVGETMTLLCGSPIFFKHLLCNKFLYIASGETMAGISRRLARSIFIYSTDITSTKIIAHFAQNIDSGKFGEFSYGSYSNELRYGSRSPPAYDLSKITVPMSIVYSNGDQLVPPRDVRKLIKKLKNVKESHYIEKRYFGHNHFIWGKTASELVYKKLVKFLHSDL